MTLDRVYDRAIMKAYSARIELHSLAAEAAYEGMTRSFARAIAYWEAERDAADEALAAITAIRARLIRAETRAAVDDAGVKPRQWLIPPAAPKLDNTSSPLPHDYMRDEARWVRYTSPHKRLLGSRRDERLPEDESEPTSADFVSMQTMTFGRVYDRALAKAFVSRVQVHSLALETAQEGISPSLERAIRYWDAQRDATDEALAAILAIRVRLVRAETRTKVGVATSSLPDARSQR